MKALRNPIDKKMKTKNDLIQLYAMVIKEKPRYQYDLKKLILDLFPDKKNLLAVFVTKKEYSLSQSIEDFGKLEFSEHRFINFLKFTDFREAEIKRIFEVHYEIIKSDEPPIQYQYSNKELYSFLRNLTPPLNIKINHKIDESDHDETLKSIISAKEIEELYSR